MTFVEALKRSVTFLYQNSKMPGLRKGLVGRSDLAIMIPIISQCFIDLNRVDGVCLENLHP